MLKRTWRKYRLTFDPDGSKLLLSLKAAVIGLIGFLLTSYFTLQQPLFIFLPAVLFMIIAPAPSVRKYFFSMLFAGFFAALGVFLVSLAPTTSILIVSLSLLALIIVFLSYNKHLYSNSAIIALLIIVFAAGSGGDVSLGLIRAENIFLGLILALFFMFLIFPFYTFRHMVLKTSYALDKLAEFFYHAMADSLRGNHLQLQHAQSKNKLIEFFINDSIIRAPIFGLHKKELEKLAHIVEQEQVLFNSIVATTNVFNSPLYYSSMSIFSLPIEKFTAANYQFYKKLALSIETKEKYTAEFEAAQLAIAKLITDLQERLKLIAQSATPYQGPDLTNLIYLLFILKERNTTLFKVMQPC